MAHSPDLKPKDEFVSYVEHSGPSLSRNVNAKIWNPLMGISRDNLQSQVRAFCSEYGFEDKQDIFFRGALAAQNPKDYEDIAELTDDDKYWLRREVTNRWHLPKALYYTIALCSLGSAIQGWDNTGANGANLSFPKEFGIEDNGWLVGVINSGPTLFGLLSAWAADPVNNLLGRRGTVFVTGLFCIFPVLAQAFTQNWWGLLICRLFMGLGMGIKISTIPVFSAEVAPASIRGGLVTSFQLWVSFGMFVGYCCNLIFYRVGKLAWRFQLASAFAPAIPVVIFVWFCPESPRWLMKKGRYTESFQSFCRLRNTEMQSARDLYYAHCQVMEEKDAFAGVSFWHRAWELFSVPRLRRAVVASGWIVISQQFSGINIARIPCIAFFIYLFTAFYGPGMGPLPSIYFSEAFPLSHRELGAGLTICINNAVGSALSLTFPSLLKALGPTGAFGFYAGLNMLAFVVIFFIVPETMKRTLEELDFIFGVPTRRHISYQVGTWLPWFIKKYIFFQRKAKLEPLYKLDGVVDTSSA
ncbi:hypothetical protein ACHAPE_009893 [Trichoderma viride]